MTKRLVALLAALMLIAAACAAEGADQSAEEDESSDTTAAAGVSDVSMFGDLASPCGAGDATIAEGEGGRGTDKIYVGVATDRASDIRPGLMKELWDASTGFVQWCNSQGGIAGLEIEMVDIDGKVLEIESAMATACSDTFAMVGGAYAQDNLIFSGKDGTDMHKCGLINIPSWAVSTDVNEGEGVVTPVPNPAYVKPATWMQDLAALYPDEVKTLQVVYGTLPSIVQNGEQVMAMAEATDGWGVIDPIEYDVISQDWNIVANQVISSKATAVSFVGEAANFSKFTQKLSEQNYEGLVFADANQYDELVISTSGAEAVEGAIVRTANHLFEEADEWPAIAQFVDLMADVPDAKVAALGVQSFSAFLLFAQSFKACAETGDPVSRACVLKEAKGVTEWNAGGLHATSNPGENLPPECSMLVQIQDGKFTRLFPELGSDDANDEGFSCGDPGYIEIEGDFGSGAVDPEGKY